MKGLNHFYFNEKLAFIFEFIPLFVLFVSIFGYTILLVFIKWSIDWSVIGTNKAPSIINLMLNTFIKFGKVVNIN